MSVSIGLFLLDVALLQQVVQPAMAEFEPGARAGTVTRLLEQAQATADRKAGSARPWSPPSRAEMGPTPSARAEASKALEDGVDALQPSRAEALRLARIAHAELAQGPVEARSRDTVRRRVARALVKNLCVPWESFAVPEIMLTGSYVEAYLLDHGASTGEIGLAGPVLDLAPGWSVQLVTPAEAREWAERLKRWGPPRESAAREQHETFRALFEVAAKGERLQLAVDISE